MKRATLLSLALLAGCTNPHAIQPPPPSQPTAWSAAPSPQSEAIFHSNPRWLGADAAYSIPLSPNRSLWLFGDTFIGLTPQNVRTESIMVRNSIGILQGDTLSSGRMEFAWRTKTDGTPGSFFPEKDKHLYWPGHGIRLANGPLVIFLYVMIDTPGQGLGFACAGYALAVVENPDDAPSDWRVQITEQPPQPFDAVPATAVVQQGPWVVALAVRQNGVHAGALVRYPANALARGDLSDAQWWMGPQRGWVSQTDMGLAGPTWVMDDAGAECSLHWDAPLQRFVHVASYGFGATQVGVRTAPAITGPWSAPTMVYRPPEDNQPKPFVYAAKGHPELHADKPGGLVVTYATNSLEFGELVSPDGQKRLYWPRVVEIVPVGGR
ncbi:MAG: DUF4185 domain-containing protein [Phycisphaerales bacterium]